MLVQTQDRFESLDSDVEGYTMELAGNGEVQALNKDERKVHHPSGGSILIYSSLITLALCVISELSLQLVI